MSEKSGILYVQTSDDPARQYPMLVLAQAAKAMDLEPTLFFMGAGLRVLVPGVADEMQLGTYPSVGDMLASLIEMEVPIMVCEASRQLFGWDSVDLVEGVKIAGAATLNDMALDHETTICF